MRRRDRVVKKQSFALKSNLSHVLGDVNDGVIHFICIFTVNNLGIKFNGFRFLFYLSSHTKFFFTKQEVLND